MPYHVEFRPEAIEDIKSLDPVVAQRIVKKIQWLGENLERITPEALKGGMKGLFKLRVGNYRVIYSLLMVSYT